MSQTDYVQAKLPPIQTDAILLIKDTKDGDAELYIPDMYKTCWNAIDRYWSLAPEEWHKINGKSVYWSLLRYE